MFEDISQISDTANMLIRASLGALGGQPGPACNCARIVLYNLKFFG